MEQERPLMLSLTSVPPFPPRSSLPRMQRKCHLEFHLLYPGLHRALQQGHVFPHNGVVAVDASLSLALQKALDDTMVATFTSNTKSRREFVCKLSGVGQKLSPRDIAP